MSSCPENDGDSLLMQKRSGHLKATLNWILSLTLRHIFRTSQRLWGALDYLGMTLWLGTHTHQNLIIKARLGAVYCLPLVLKLAGPFTRLLWYDQTGFWSITQIESPNKYLRVIRPKLIKAKNLGCDDCYSQKSCLKLLQRCSNQLCE